MKTQTDPRLLEFCTLVKSGLDSWVKAGELLCAIQADDPDAFGKLVKMQPELSTETLRTFVRLGKREIYPPLLSSGSVGARKLLELPYSEQVRLCAAPINVAVLKGGEVVIEQRTLCELSRREAEVAFNCKSVRPIKEQMELMKGKSRVGRTPSFRGKIEETFTEDDSDTANGKLGEAQAAMLRARELLGENITPKQDAFLTTALKNIGWLRFEINGDT